MKRRVHIELTNFHRNVDFYISREEGDKYIIYKYICEQVVIDKNAYYGDPSLTLRMEEASAWQR